MRRAVLLGAIALAACSTEDAESCPGEAVARFTFTATRATEPLAAGLDPEPALTDCAAALGFNQTLNPFEGTIAADGGAGALCRTRGSILFGTTNGLRWWVEASSDGAVLGACGATCAATSRLVIAGDVLPSAAEPALFQGALIEQLSAPDGGCDACALPCAARYVLEGTVVP